MRVFLLGATPRFDSTAATSSAERLRLTSGNTGNQLIAHGLLETFKHTSVNWDYRVGPDRAEAESDVIVVAAANFIYRGFDLGGMADFIGRTKLPVVMAGLGAQAPARSFDVSTIPAGTLRFLKIVSERSRSIGVRGAFTAETLAKVGITNCEEIGCPSYYLNGDRGFVIQPRGLMPDDPIVVHASRDVVSHSSAPDRLRALVPELYMEAARRNGIFVAQTEMEEITVADAPYSSPAMAAGARIRPLLGTSLPPREVDRWIQDRVRVYWEVDRWLAELRPYAFSVGTRIHGTLAALHAGVPAVCLAHDARTGELCETLGLSAVDVSNVPNPISIEQLYREFDLQKLERRYAELLPRYSAFLAKNGLTPSWTSTTPGS